MVLKYWKRKTSRQATVKLLDKYLKKQYTNKVDMEIDMSELEVLVTRDMIINGYNPNSKEDIQKYWKERLS